MQEAGLATPQGLLRIRCPGEGDLPLLLRLRCYLPSTSAILRDPRRSSSSPATAPRATPAPASAWPPRSSSAVGLVGLAAGTIVISAVTIQRRRAAAGACHTCSHLCRGAMVPLPERDTRRWPHRPLTPQGLPLVVISAPPDARTRAVTASGCAARRSQPIVLTSLLRAAPAEPAPSAARTSTESPVCRGTPEPQRLRGRSYPARQTTSAGPTGPAGS